MLSKAIQLASEMADIIQEKYLHMMYGLRTACVSHKNELEDLKLLVGLHKSGVSCIQDRNLRIPEVKPLVLPNFNSHNNSNLFP